MILSVQKRVRYWIDHPFSDKQLKLDNKNIIAELYVRAPVTRVTRGDGSLGGRPHFRPRATLESCHWRGRRHWRHGDRMCWCVLLRGQISWLRRIKYNKCVDVSFMVVLLRCRGPRRHSVLLCGFARPNNLAAKYKVEMILNMWS